MFVRYKSFPSPTGPKIYYYLVETYRDKVGRVHQRHLAYLGKNIPGDAELNAIKAKVLEQKAKTSENSYEWSIKDSNSQYKKALTNRMPIAV